MKTEKIYIYSKQLDDQIHFVQTFIQKKEISIWAATVLYIAIIGFSLSLIFGEKIILDCMNRGLYILAISVITQIFIVFIYSQFSVWIYSIAHLKTLRRGLREITFNSKKFKYEDLIYDLKLDLPKFLIPIYEEEKLLENQFHEKWRPIKIIGFTILGFLTLFLGKTWRKKLSKNREKQEGLIYCLLIFIWICFIIFVSIK